MDWTPTQQKAILTQDKNLIVSAAAGSGKTTVMTERILKLIEGGADISRFLIVTFTDAATNEMKQRINSRILRAAAQSDNASQKARLYEQAMAVGRANISTLHSFCLYILRRNFHKLGLDPSFSAADDVLGSMLFKEALQTAAQEAYERSDEGFRELMRSLNANEDELMLHAQNMYHFLKARPDPWVFLNAAVDYYKTGGKVLAPAMLEVLNSQKHTMDMIIKKLQAARDLIPHGQSYIKPKSILDNDMSIIRAISNSTDFTVFYDRLNALEFATFAWGSRENPDIRDNVRKIRESARNDVNKIKVLFPRSMADEEALMKKMHRPIESLAAYLRRVDEIYSALKQARAKIDFEDMEHLALKALEDTDIKSTLMNRFDYVFVDEYQDSSLIQERLIDKVRRSDNLFLVGDIKQSIYRFRQAEPELFIKRLRSFASEDNSEAIHLNTNYRSSLPVIDAVNGLFSLIMSEEAGEIDYDDNAKLVSPDDKQIHESDGVEFHIIDKSEKPEDDSDDDNEEESQSADMVCEARLAAKRIHELMNEDKSLCFSDFAILLRSPKNNGELWASTLAQAGIPAYVQLTGGYFDAIEVQVFLNLLRVIDNRRQDIPLVSVLRSPIFNFSEEELIEIRTGFPAPTLFESLEQIRSEQSELGEKVSQVFERLKKWKRESLLLPLEDFVAELFYDSLFYECMGALTDGVQRQANLDALAQNAAQYAAAGGACDLYSFLKYMDGAKDTAKVGAAKPGAKDMVRILSIHSAKGLEFPIVIIGELNKKFNLRDTNNNILLDSDMGIGARLIIDGKKRDSVLRLAVRHRMRKKDVAEEMRVLYVAMTRAKSRLILICSMKNARQKLDDAKDIELTPQYCINAKGYTDWLFPACALGVFAPMISLIEYDAEPQQEREPEEFDLDDELEKLNERFSWRYPHTDAADIPSKLSVSELLSNKTKEIRVPLFAKNDESLSPAQIGAATHLFLKEVRLSFDTSPKEHVLNELERIKQRGSISKSGADAVSKRDMQWLLSSDIFTRMCQSPLVERELEFSVELPACSLIDTKSAEPVLLQGVIDCCFIEDGEWVIVDYKTDRVQKSIEEAAKPHEEQLKLYALALNKLTGKPVKQLLVVMLRAHSVVGMAW